MYQHCTNTGHAGKQFRKTLCFLAPATPNSSGIYLFTRSFVEHNPPSMSQWCMSPCNGTPKHPILVTWWLSGSTYEEINSESLKFWYYGRKKKNGIFDEDDWGTRSGTVTWPRKVIAKDIWFSRCSMSFDSCTENEWCEAMPIYSDFLFTQYVQYSHLLGIDLFLRTLSCRRLCRKFYVKLRSKSKIIFFLWPA